MNLSLDGHFVRRIIRLFILSLLAALPSSGFAGAFKAGFAMRDVTPTAPVPMWGYGGLGPRLSSGIFDPLHAKVVVIDVGDHKLAIMGLDIGRGPRESSMKKIREAVLRTSGVDFVMISGSHTHHGPALELTEKEGQGKGKYDDAVAYVAEFEQKLIDAINEAAANAKPAKMGVGSVRVPFTRNRHSKINPKPIDDELSVIRFDGEDGKIIGLVTNYSAHATIINAGLRKFSAEWPGQMMNYVEAGLDTHCLFMQGSAGDLSPNTTDVTFKMAKEWQKADVGQAEKAKAAGQPSPLEEKSKLEDLYVIQAFGKQVSEEVIKLAQGITTAVPATPSIQGIENEFSYQMRISITDPKIKARYTIAFFKELVEAFGNELRDNIIRPHLTTIILNKDLALVGGSGEFFSNHSNRLKQRARIKTLFFGYCNGHHMYFPTIEGAAEGGYGADPTVSWVAIGAGEEMMNRALINIYTMQGAYDFKMP